MQNLYLLVTILGLSTATCLTFFKKVNVNAVQTTNQNQYQALRQQAITVTPKQLQLNLSSNHETVYGTILEFGTNEGTATIVSFLTGDASMYTSGGGGIIGGASNQHVRNAAINFVSAAQRCFSKMNKTYNLNTPKAGNIKFYVLTSKAIYSFEDKEANVAKEGSKFGSLFYEGNNLISQLRLLSSR